ncbi:porin family protein [Chitinophaga filiformis]|uniref:porin family protein n=1 Tax=Chitinophaga filiformis TaxID=104663 RepID=UPI001F363AEF|nr:porin family protein [Chitinophaga filiformis]MCF6402480.1 porin family protein [Chitinophaga filiformis]
MNVIELFRKACLTAICVLLLTGARAQTTTPSLDKKVRVPLKEVNITTLGDMITAQTGFILSFNAQKIIAWKQLQLRQSSYSIQQLLTMIKEATGSEYVIYQDHVIFRQINNKRAASQTAAFTQTTKQIAARKPTGISRQAVSIAGKEISMPASKQTDHIATRKNTARYHTGARTASQMGPNKGSETGASSHSASNKNNNNRRNILTDRTSKAKDIKTAIKPDRAVTTPATDMAVHLIPNSLSCIAPLQITIPAIKPVSPALIPLSPPAGREKKRYIYEKPGLFKPFVQAGFAADDALYANLQAKAGITLVYGIVSWSTNFSVSGFRYGAGISYPLNNGWLIELEATTGKLFKETPIHIDDDTTNTRPPLFVNSRLQRVCLFAQKSIAPHLSVYAGPVFNHLKSTYQLSTWSLSVATLQEISLTPEKDYMTIRPPYTLHRSPAEEIEDIRVWIGFQIGISYRL